MLKPITDTDLRFAPHFTLAWRAHRDQDLANVARCAGMVDTARSFERASIAAEIELVALQPLCSRDYQEER